MAQLFVVPHLRGGGNLAPGSANLGVLKKKRCFFKRRLWSTHMSGGPADPQRRGGGERKKKEAPCRMGGTHDGPDLVEVVASRLGRRQVRVVPVQDLPERLRETVRHALHVGSHVLPNEGGASQGNLGDLFDVRADGTVEFEVGSDDEGDTFFRVYLDLVERVGADMPTQEEVDNDPGCSVVDRHSEDSVCHDAAALRESLLDVGDVRESFDEEVDSHLWSGRAEHGLSSPLAPGSRNHRVCVRLVDGR